ncbi:MAG: hypothetical protein AAF193_10035, partial [Bacteroidota bacterium]
MRLFIHFFLFSFAIAMVFTTWSQNLVKNASFEERSYCPVNFNQQRLRILTSWQQPNNATPDYFKECSKEAGVPENLFGNQVALEGEAYAGIVTYASSKRNYREYLQQKLTRPLKPGEIVCVEYWLSAADRALYVTDGFGAHFSKTPLNSHTQKIFEVRPQV